MTATLKELDEVIANGDPHTSDYFLRDHHTEIRAALELKARVDSGDVIVPRELLSEIEEQLIDLANEKASNKGMHNERERIFDADVLQYVRLLLKAATNTNKESEDAS